MLLMSCEDQVADGLNCGLSCSTSRTRFFLHNLQRPRTLQARVLKTHDTPVSALHGPAAAKSAFVPCSFSTTGHHRAMSCGDPAAMSETDFPPADEDAGVQAPAVTQHARVRSVHDYSALHCRGTSTAVSPQRSDRLRPKSAQSSRSSGPAAAASLDNHQPWQITALGGQLHPSPRTLSFNLWRRFPLLNRKPALN